MDESKIDLTERLRREGRWSEASKAKDETISRLRKEGMKRVDASDEAWRRIAEQFPPLPKPTESEQSNAALTRDGDDEDPLEAWNVDTAGASPDLVGDILWVYGRLDSGQTVGGNAPSRGDVNLLRWARNSRNRFFEQVLPKALAAQKRGYVAVLEESAEPDVAQAERILRDITQSC
ncbi:MAG TPA: hypothetical protein DD670_07600 [Planctomycetaceae bacterium]|nr:hypothetical protein [Planctomycetaceae bacterium]